MEKTNGRRQSSLARRLFKGSAIGLIFCLSQPVQAMNLNLKYGVGVGGFSPDLQQKYGSAGIEGPLVGDLWYGLDGGAYFDSKRDLVTFTGFAQLGSRLSPLSWLYAQNMFGVGYISQRDELLGSRLQFALDIGIGLQNDAGSSIGLNYRHISNAGITLPNHGRDYIQMKVSFGI